MPTLSIFESIQRFQDWNHEQNQNLVTVSLKYENIEYIFKILK